ncbi:MAG: glycosyltransferase family 4 protein [Elusimicrobia bacterium]|nr:glycosyltransferase family 4 protein [Elusimicrobiota bacterium]
MNVHSRIWGGTEAFSVSLVRQLDRRRFDPLVYASTRGPSTVALTRASIRWIAPNREPADEIEFLRSRLTALRIDVVQANHLNSSLALAAKSIRIPVVWRIGGHVGEIMKGARADAKKRALAVVGIVADRVICASRFLAGQFDDLGGPAPITTIYNGVDLELIREEARHPVVSRTPTIGMVGHLVPQKRHLDFLTAARLVKARFPNARFRIFGGPYPSDRDAAYAARLGKEARRLGLASDLSFENRRREKFRHYAGVDVMAFPGLNEGSSNAILESMALGRPVVAADSGGNPELIDDGRTGVLVPPASPRRLAAALVELVGDSARRARLGSAAQADVARRFDISDCAARYGEVYETLTRGRGRIRP